MRPSALCLLGLSLLHTPAVFAQPASVDPILGPFWSGTILAPRSLEAIAMKGIAVAVGQEKKAYLCYDTDLLRVSLAWTGDFLAFGNSMTRIQLPVPPLVRGTPHFRFKNWPGLVQGWLAGRSSSKSAGASA